MRIDFDKGMRGEDFYLVLPSNVAPETFPKNEPNHYYTPLSQPLYLDDPGWKVALKEITYQNMVQTIVDEHIEVWQDQFEPELVEHIRFGNRLDPVGDYITYTKRSETIQFSIDLKGSNFVKKYHSDTGVVLKYSILGGGLEEKRFSKVEEASITLRMPVKGEMWLYATPLPKIVQTIRPREMYYSNKRKLMDEINRHLPAGIAFSVVVETEEKRIQLSSLLPTHHLVLRNGMHDVLGFKEKVLTKAPQTAFYRAYLSRGSFAMFVYCDLIDPVVVGNTQVPLLRTVHLPSTEQGATVNQIFNPPIYLRISKRIVNTIEIDIRTDTGDSFPLRKDGKIILTLHVIKD